MAKKVEGVKLRDVESFLGIPAANFASENAKNLHPSLYGFDVLRVVSTSALVLQYGEQEYRDQEKEKPVKKFVCYSKKKRLIPDTTPPQQLWLKTESLQQEKRDNKRGVKRPLQFNDDDYQQEENNRSKRKTSGSGNKKRMGSGSGSGSGSGQDQYPMVPLPLEMEKLIQESRPDEEPVLVIRKELEKTDLNEHENRMSVPAKRVRGRFLRDEEEEKLNRRKQNKSKEFIEVPIIMPRLTRGVVKLRKWDMAKNNGTGSAIYVLTGDWNNLIKHQGFKAKTEVQLWAYRVNGELCFALVNLGISNPNPIPNGSSSIASPSYSFS